MDKNTSMPLPEASCCNIAKPMSFEKELELSVQNNITRLSRVQQAINYVKQHREDFTKMSNLGIRFYLE